jgi:hypothetical protein
MSLYAEYLILFVVSALLSGQTRRVPGEYARMFLPGFVFGLLVGGLHLATIRVILLFATLSAVAHFVAELLAMKIVRFEKQKPPSQPPHRGKEGRQSQKGGNESLKTQVKKVPASQARTMVFDARSMNRLFAEVAAEMLAKAETTFATKSVALAGAVSGFVGSLCLALNMTLVAGSVFGWRDYFHIVSIGALTGIIFLFIAVSRKWPTEIGYFIWQSAVGIALLIPLYAASYHLRLSMLGLYSKFVGVWHGTRHAPEGGWYDFLFGTSALQNYLSELFGILVALFVVDRLISYRAERRERPRRDMACILAFEMMDNFISKYLPEPYNRNGMSARRFGAYRASSGVYSFHESVLSWTEVQEQIASVERERWERINWPADSDSDGHVRRGEETTLKGMLADIRQYGSDLATFLLQHQGVLDEEISRQIGEIRFTIGTGLAGYYEPLKPNYAWAFGVDIKTLLPEVLRQTIELSLHLDRIYGHEHAGGLSD